MSDFKKLKVWQDARALTVSTITACDDMSGSTATIVRGQLVRAIMSVPANIAEGSAKRSDREFARFVRIALGSTTESENHLIIAHDLVLIRDDDFASLTSQIEEVRKMLTGLEKRLTGDANKANNVVRSLALLLAGSGLLAAVAGVWATDRGQPINKKEPPNHGGSHSSQPRSAALRIAGSG
jgi:four helix bundle protein